MPTEQDKIHVKLLKAGTLQLAGNELDCAVVEDPQGKPVRVLSRRKFQLALGRDDTARKDVIVQIDSNDETQTIEIPYFLSAENLRPFITESIYPYLMPLWFKTATGWLAAGYRAELLPAVCDIYLSAKDARTLKPQQEAIAEHCYHLIRAFATVGIIALVDEVTGYQEHREKDELHKLITYFLGEQPQPWMQTFSAEFYREAFRLFGLAYHPDSHKRPPIIGQFTAKAIYSQILPAPVYDELKTRNPWLGCGKRQELHHQWLTPDGRAQLTGHLKLVLHLMRAAHTHEHFWRLMAAGHPRAQLTLAFFDDTLPAGEDTANDVA